MHFLANKTASSVRQRWGQKTAVAVLCNEITSPVIVSCSQCVLAETCYSCTQTLIRMSCSTCLHRVHCLLKSVKYIRADSKAGKLIVQPEIGLHNLETLANLGNIAKPFAAANCNHPSKFC